MSKTFFAGIPEARWRYSGGWRRTTAAQGRKMSGRGPWLGRTFDLPLCNCFSLSHWTGREPQRWLSSWDTLGVKLPGTVSTLPFLSLKSSLPKERRGSERGIFRKQVGQLQKGESCFFLKMGFLQRNSARTEKALCWAFTRTKKKVQHVNRYILLKTGHLFLYCPLPCGFQKTFFF